VVKVLAVWDKSFLFFLPFGRESTRRGALPVKACVFSRAFKRLGSTVRKCGGEGNLFRTRDSHLSPFFFSGKIHDGTIKTQFV